MPLTRPRQDIGIITPHAPDHWAGPDDRDPVVHWQSLLDARLIGTSPQLSPAALASIHAAAAIACPRRAGALR